jgi:hypothetical protein
MAMSLPTASSTRRHNAGDLGDLQRSGLNGWRCPGFSRRLGSPGVHEFAECSDGRTVGGEDGHWRVARPRMRVHVDDDRVRDGASQRPQYAVDVALSKGRRRVQGQSHSVNASLSDGGQHIQQGPRTHVRRQGCDRSPHPSARRQALRPLLCMLRQIGAPTPRQALEAIKAPPEGESWTWFVRPAAASVGTRGECSALRTGG